MIVFTNDCELILQAENLNDAIEIIAVVGWKLSDKAGIHLEGNRGGALKLFIPFRDWPCHSHPSGQKAWCDSEGLGGFMGHTCIKGKRFV
jgi:hypothetical protein